jgi:SAM-dependent methyltransferase
MLIETAKIIRRWLSELSNITILNVCSSDERYMKMRQPWIWFEVIKPLSDRGCRIFNLDIKQAPGVDIVNDCTNMVDVENNQFDIVFFFEGIEHIIDVSKALSEIYRVLKDDGVLYASAPGVYPKHDDPIDTLLRLPSLESWERVLGSAWIIDCFEKTQPVPAKRSYRFDKLVYSTTIRASKKFLLHHG